MNSTLVSHRVRNNEFYMRLQKILKAHTGIQNSYKLDVESHNEWREADDMAGAKIGTKVVLYSKTEEDEKYSIEKSWPVTEYSYVGRLEEIFTHIISLISTSYSFDFLQSDGIFKNEVSELKTFLESWVSPQGRLYTVEFNKVIPTNLDNYATLKELGFDKDASVYNANVYDVTASDRNRIISLIGDVIEEGFCLRVWRSVMFYDTVEPKGNIT